MKLKLFLSLSFIAIGVFFYHCETTKIISFINTESQSYFESGVIDPEKHKRNIVDGILFTVDIKPADEGEFAVWLGINSMNQPPSIRLVNASIRDQEKSRCFDYKSLRMDLGNDNCEKNNHTYECNIMLFNHLAQNKLDAFTQKDDFLIKVELEMNAKIVKQSFHIRRKIKKFKIAFS
jgi:hypothetical protein